MFRVALNRVALNRSIVVVVAFLTVACTGAPAATQKTSNPTPPSVAAVSPAPATSAPTPSHEAVGILSAGGTTMFAGVYRTNFRPALAITITKEVDLDCVPGYHCRGGVNINDAGVLDLEFGNLHGSEIDVIALAKVFDNVTPPKLIDPPADLAKWAGSLKGTAVLGAPVPVIVGGVAGTAFDVTTPGEVQFGMATSPTDWQAGIGPNGLRVIFLRVHGQAIVIEEWVGPENEGDVRDRPAALESLQPLVDSIVWD